MLLEAIEQRIQSRADASFALFLEEFARRFEEAAAAPPKPTWEWRAVEQMLRGSGLASLPKLRHAARIMPSSKFIPLIDQYQEILRKLRMREDASGGYHALRTMTDEDLADIVKRLLAVAPGLREFYQRFRTQCDLKFQGLYYR